MIAPPQYECVVHTKDKNRGVELINKALKQIEEAIKMRKGNFLKKMEPKVVGEKEDTEAPEEEGSKIVFSDEENEEGMDVDLPGKKVFLRCV